MFDHEPRRFSVLISSTLLVFTFAASGDCPALRAQTEPLKRTILTRSPDPGNPAYEVVLVDVEVGPHGGTGRHYHHGLESGYVLDGSLTIAITGSAPTTVTAGHSYNIAASTIHDATNETERPTKILAVYVVEKDKPLAEASR